MRHTNFCLFIVTCGPLSPNRERVRLLTTSSLDQCLTMLCPCPNQHDQRHDHGAGGPRRQHGEPGAPTNTTTREVSDLYQIAACLPVSVRYLPSNSRLITKTAIAERYIIGNVQ